MKSDKIDTGYKSCHIPILTAQPYQTSDGWHKLCEACAGNMKLVESQHPDQESEWQCRCGNSEFSQMSLFDHKQYLHAERLEIELEFLPEEIRAPKVERLRRREICNACDYLKEQNICACCGCPVKHRTYYADLSCPANFW